MSRWHDAPPLFAPAERAAAGHDAEWIVRSPGVGWWAGAPEPGHLLGDGSPIGTLTQLNRHFSLRLRGAAAGRVVDGAPRPHAQAVEFGQELFRLRPLVDEAARVAEADAVPGGLAVGDRPVVAPTDGVFYRKPAPDAPDLVKAGDRLQRGQPIGLIEVMKTFNQILYEGGDLPDEAEVVEVRALDATDVRAGDVLLIVRAV